MDNRTITPLKAPERLAKTNIKPFDLVSYARKRRYRLRNLHDGYLVPPAICREPCDRARGYWGKDDRWDAIVGHRGYVAMDGDKLSVALFYDSPYGVSVVLPRLEALGASVDQLGDMEVGATAPVEQIEQVLKLIKVSKLRPGDVRRFSSHTGAVDQAKIT